MRILSLIHRWAGGLIGLLLALLGLTGTLLVWDSLLVRLPGASDPLVEDVAKLATITEKAAADGSLARITFASDELRLHEAAFSNGGGAYFRQDGSVVDRWQTIWERPELWLFDFHHHLFAGKTGDTFVGIAGLAGVAFTVTGMILWWRSRRKFSPRLLPRSWSPAAIVHHHRDIGIIAAPLLLLSSATGALMIFPSLQRALFGEGLVAETVTTPPRAVGPVLSAALKQSKQRFPDAAIRRIVVPSELGKPVSVRLKQPFEWTPNGRTQLSFDARTGALLSVQDPAEGSRGAGLQETIYPLHAAKVGGIWFKLAMTVSGLVMTMLGAFATYSFWFRKASKRRKSRTARPRSQTITTATAG